MTVAPEQAGGSPAIEGACSLRPWWHAGKPPARFPTAHTTGGRATREVGNSTLRDPKCDLPHAGASERRVGSPCPPHLVPAGSRRRRRGTFQAKQPASRKLQRQARHARGRAFQSLKNANPPNAEISMWRASDATAVAQP